MEKAPLSTKTFFGYSLWDMFCALSVVGIWPRFIEPKLIFTTSLNCPIPDLHDDLLNFKIIQFSDLHFHKGVSNDFLKRLSKKINSMNPNLITFTGDFLCYSKLEDKERLLSFLNSLKASHGCYTIFGNHDYAKCVSINSHGEYDIFIPESSSLNNAFRRLFKTIALKKRICNRVKTIEFHKELTELLNKSSFKLLHNSSDQILIKNTKLNICGLGEYILGRVDTQTAFSNYSREYPGIILLHNPDGTPLLQNCPGDIILSGHTHGGQVNIPWMWRKFTLLENMKLKKGLVKINDKSVYINRGVGSVLPFRWFSPPEILLLTLKRL